MIVSKDIQVTFDNKQDVNILRSLVGLGLLRLEDVNKEAWGKDYDEQKTWGNLFLEKTKL